MRNVILAGGALALGIAAACANVDSEPDDHDHGQSGPHAHAKIEARSGSKLTGNATFTEVAGGVLVEIEVQGVSPGYHAVHVHEKGDCSAPDGASAGGHFNPASKNHGSPHAADHHAGDLGSMLVDDKGNGHHVILMPDLSVRAGPSSVVGRAIIVHEKIDDLVTQPTGNAGGRIGCGVIVE